jgi:hypothetical protein
VSCSQYYFAVLTWQVFHLFFSQFLSLRQIPEKRSKGGKISFGSQFQTFQSLVSLLFRFWACAWSDRESWQRACGGVKGQTGGRGTKRKSSGHNTSFKSLPPVTYFLQPGPTPNSPFSYDLKWGITCLFFQRNRITYSTQVSPLWSSSSLCFLNSKFPLILNVNVALYFIYTQSRLNPDSYK